MYIATASKTYIIQCMEDEPDCDNIGGDGDMN